MFAWYPMPTKDAHMPSSTPAAQATPRQTDEALAALYTELYRVEDRMAAAAQDMLRTAGAQFYYRGRQRVTDMTLVEAAAKLRARAAYVAEFKRTHAYRDGDYNGTDWAGFQGAPHEADAPAKALARRAEYEAAHQALVDQIDELEATYTGWSRFFLVTSSPGHVHSSMHCSTCRPTTRYAWMPSLSGKNEAAAVKELGPTLCSVCFPTAPTAWTTGKKLTAAQAAKKAAALS